MRIRTAALALSVAVAGLAAGQAFAQDRDVRPYGWDRGEHHAWRHDRDDYYRHAWRRDHDDYRMHRTVVIHHREYPMHHVVVRSYHHHHPAYVVNRHVTVIHNQG
jgi:hypothetical protein